MKICIFNEFKNCGGTEKYVKNLKNILKDDNDISLLYFTYQDTEKYDDNETVIQSSFGKLSKFIFDCFMYSKIRKYLENVKPDIIVVNNMVSSPITQYATLHGYKVLQVIHDYGIVCPKSTCLQDNEIMCKNSNFIGCIHRCSYHGSKLQITIKMLQVKMVSVIRKKNVNCFITPSKMLAKYMEDDGYKNIIAVPNPHYLKECLTVSKGKKKRYIYIGGICDNKGITELIEGFEMFSRGKDVRLDLYGPINDEVGKRAVESIQSSKIHYYGKVDNNEVGDIISRAYAIIVPSKWMENYPTTILEGFAYRTVVIGSDRGGIPEMLESNRGILFHFGVNNLILALEKSYGLSKYEYK